MISVAVTEDEFSEVCERLLALGARSIDVVAPGDARRVVLAAVDEADAAGVAASLRADGAMAVTRPDGGPSLRKWLHDTGPVTFDGRLTVCPVWSEHDRRRLPGLVELGPGGFGNGRHPTTRQMIEELLERIVGRERVLDVGCGSGILALAALKIGAASAVAADINPDAVAAARRNAEINGMGDRLEATLAPLAAIDGTFDVVLANISRAGIVELAPELVSHLAPGGWLAVGGISPTQCEQAAGFLRPLVEAARRACGEWATLVLTHRGRVGGAGDDVNTTTVGSRGRSAGSR